MISPIKVLAAVSLVLLMTLNSAHAAEPINTLDRSGLWGYKASGVAIRGYDPVAYFTDGRPRKGSDKFTTEYESATWKFASQEHLDLFEAEPEKYAPQYGGYCAYGVAQDYLVKIEPENWTIVDGKLYLNYDDEVQEKWENNIPDFLKSADSKFSQLLESE